MTERTVKTSLIAQADQYIAEFTKAADATRKVRGEQEALAAKARAFEQVGKVAFTVGATAAAGMALAVTRAADFDAAMSNVSAATMETAENMALLRQAALDYGESSVFSATESAGAIEELGKAGLSTADILSGGLAASLDLAAAGELGIARAAEIAAITMSQFSLSGAEAGRVADVLAAGAGKALGSVDDLANGLKFVGPIAASMGVSLEETTGVLALFAQQGIIGEQAGTSLRGMLSSLTSPSKMAKDEINRLGITLYDSQGAFLGLENVAGQLSNAYSGMTQQSRDASLGILFGNEQITAARVLYAAGAEGVREWTAAVDDSGFASEVAAKRLDNLKGDFEELSGSIETALIEIGSNADGPLRFLVQEATDAVSAFNNLDPAAQTVTATIGSVVAIVGLAGGAFFTAVPKIAEFKSSMAELGPRTQAVGRAVGVLTKGLGALAAALAVVSLLDKLSQSGAAAALTIEEITGALLANDLDGAFEANTKAVDDLDGALETLFANDPASAFDRWGQEVFAFTGLTSTLGQSKDTFNEIGLSLGNLVNSGEAERAAAIFEGYAERAAKWGASTEDVLELMPAYRDALAGVANEQTLAADATDATSAALEEQSAAAEETENAVNDLIDSIRDFGSVELDARAAVRDLEAAIDDATDSIEQNGASLDRGTEAGRANEAALDAIARSANDAAAAIYDQTGSIDESSAALARGREQYILVGEQMGLTREQAEEYADALIATPDTIQTNFELVGAARAEEAIQAFYANWNNKPLTVKFFADTYNLDASAAASAARYSGMAVRYARPNADGGMYSYADGGFGEGMYSGGTPLYKFAEPETRWEAFISGRQGMEERNRQVWADAGQRLGMFDGGSTRKVEQRIDLSVQAIDPAAVAELVMQQIGARIGGAV